jgi:hypothetical protein
MISLSIFYYKKLTNAKKSSLPEKYNYAMMQTHLFNIKGG